MLCCCCCEDCGGDWKEYSSFCYSVGFGLNDFNYTSSGLGSKIFTNIGKMFGSNMEMGLVPFSIDGYSFLPNKYISPTYSDLLSSDIGYVISTGLTDRILYTDQEVFSFYSAMSGIATSSMGAIIKTFYDDFGSNFSDLGDYNTSSSVIFTVADKSYLKTVKVCIRDQRFSTVWSFTTGDLIGNGLFPFSIPSYSVSYTCKYAYKITLEEIQPQ